MSMLCVRGGNSDPYLGFPGEGCRVLVLPGDVLTNKDTAAVIEYAGNASGQLWKEELNLFVVIQFTSDLSVVLQQLHYYSTTTTTFYYK